MKTMTGRLAAGAGVVGLVVALGVTSVGAIQPFRPHRDNPTHKVHGDPGAGAIRPFKPHKDNPTGPGAHAPR